MSAQSDSQAASSPVSFPREPTSPHVYHKAPDKTPEHDVVAHAVQTILRDPQALYAMWRNVSAFPRWQEFVVSVTEVDPLTSHWVMGNPEDADGKRIEFDSRITEDVPGEKISWSSITKGMDVSGTVTFQPAAGGRGTRVAVQQSMKVPGGILGNAVAATFVRSPRQVVIENLRHLKQMAEAGEIPTVKGQPHGPRGLSGGIKEWMYGETNPTPPGSSPASTTAPTDQVTQGSK